MRRKRIALMIGIAAIVILLIYVLVMMLKEGGAPRSSDLFVFKDGFI